MAPKTSGVLQVCHLVSFPTRSYLVAKILLLPSFLSLFAFSSFLPLSVAFAASRRHCRIQKIAVREDHGYTCLPGQGAVSTPNSIFLQHMHAGLNHPLANLKLRLFFTIPTERSDSMRGGGNVKERRNLYSLSVCWNKKNEQKANKNGVRRIYTTNACGGDFNLMNRHGCSTVFVAVLLED